MADWFETFGQTFTLAPLLRLKVGQPRDPSDRISEKISCRDIPTGLNSKNANV